MVLREERELVVEYGKKLSQEKLSVGTSGNISVYNAEEGLMAITPSGMDYMKLKPEDVVVMDLDSHLVDSNRKPSSEWALHTGFYLKKKDIRAVVHTHPKYSTIFAVLREPIRPVHYAMAGIGTYEVPCAPYYMYGTPELAHTAVETCGEGRAVLLANHGLITCGETLPQAYDLTANVEYTAELAYRSRAIGQPVYLSEEEVKAVYESFQTYGQADSGKKGY